MTSLAIVIQSLSKICDLKYVVKLFETFPDFELS